MVMRFEWMHASGLAAACAGVLALFGQEVPPQQKPHPEPQKPQPQQPDQPRARDASAVIGMRARVDEILAGWTKEGREPAEKIIEKYGEPAEVTENMLIWHRKAPWKHIIAYREPIPHDFPVPHKDLIEMFIDARVPPDKFDDLAQFDGSVTCFRTKGEISARCDKEEMNFLALNLAEDIVQGKMSAEDARRFYARAAKAFMNGEKDPYTQGLRFDVPTGNTADPDKPMTADTTTPTTEKTPFPGKKPEGDNPK